MISNKQFQHSLLNTSLMDVPTSYRPIKDVMPIGKPSITGTVIRVIENTSGSQAGASADPSGKNGVPFALLGLSAAQTPVAYQAVVYSAVTVTFTIDPSDKNYDHVNIWVTGYHGNTNPQLVASGTAAPITFVLDATREIISIFGQTASSSGNAAPVDFAAHATVRLDGQVTNPPAPTIVQTLTPTPLGYQFSFSQISLPANDTEVISAYRVYRNDTTNTFAGSALIRTIVQDPTATGAIVVQDNVGAHQAFYYFVTSVNSVGLESSAAAAQSVTVLSDPVSSANNAVLNNNSLYTGANPLTQSGTTTTILVASSTIQFAFGTKTYNSGSVNPGSLGTWWVYADDPTHAGGAVTYAATTTQSDLTAGDGRVFFGKITTMGGGGGGGSGGGGGCFTGNCEIWTPVGLRRFDSLPSDRKFYIVNDIGEFEAKLVVHENYSDEMVDLGGGMLVTVGHYFERCGKWIPAKDHFPNLPRQHYRGTVYNLHILTDDPDAHYYVLWNGEKAHNVIKD